MIFTIGVPDCVVTLVTAHGTYSAAAQSPDMDKSYDDNEVFQLENLSHLLNQCIDDHIESILPQKIKRRPLSGGYRTWEQPSWLTTDKETIETFEIFFHELISFLIHCTIKFSSVWK